MLTLPPTPPQMTHANVGSLLVFGPSMLPLRLPPPLPTTPTTHPPRRR